MSGDILLNLDSEDEGKSLSAVPEALTPLQNLHIKRWKFLPDISSSKWK